jgi:hypothetical protein
MLFAAFRGRSFLFCSRKKEILHSLCATSSFSVSLWWKKPAGMNQQKFSDVCFSFHAPPRPLFLDALKVAGVYTRKNLNSRDLMDFELQAKLHAIEHRLAELSRVL